MMKRALGVLVFLVLAASVRAELAAYWPLNEGSGTTALDASGKGLNASLRAVDGIHKPQWTAGPGGTGTALLFNPVLNDPNQINFLYVDPNDAHSDPNVFDLGNAFTISMWVRRDNAPGTDWGYLMYTDAYDVELARNPNGTGDDLLDYLWSESYSAWHQNIGTETAEQRTLGSWYHLAITYDKLVLRKYINGTLRFTSRYIAPKVPAAKTPLYIASRAGLSGAFSGALDEIAVWCGSYLPAGEVAKLANKTATPLTVSSVQPLPDSYFTRETRLAWNSSGWRLLYGPSFSSFDYWPGENINISSNNTASVWYIKDAELPGWPNAVMIPGGHYALWSDGQQWYRFVNIQPGETYYTKAARDVQKFGMAWIDPSWSGREPQTAVFAPYITSGIAICIPSNGGYQEFVSPTHGWLSKNFFKTYARVAAVNGSGASLLVRSYSYTDGTDPMNPANLTYLGEVRLPLTKPDYVWQELKFAYPKPYPGSSKKVWTEISIVGGQPDTRVYIDEFNPISDQANTSQHYPTYLPGDYDRDTIVNSEDLITLGEGWMDSANVQEPRNTGLLVNGDFFYDLSLLDPAAVASKLSVNPTGWSFVGGSGGEKGIYLVHKPGATNIGVIDYSQPVLAPLGGTVAAYTNDPAAVLQQTAGTPAAAGQTYYAMAYVMAKDWDGWKDTVTLTLQINGQTVASFKRPLSRNRWRPIYGTYTATAADAGKPITVQLSYENTHTAEIQQPGIAYIGYVYLGTQMPTDWPESRDNLLANGGFEEIEWMIGTPYESVYNSISKSDNWGAWFTDNIPAPPGWLFEVPAGFNEADQGGIWAAGYYGSPLPSPGMNDVCIYTSETLVLGQVVGPLQSGTTYYLDMACAVNSSEYGTAAWPNPAPKMHLELWRIPAGVTDGAVIHAAIQSGNPNYVKIAEAAADATGNLSGGTGIPASKWQLIGTTYTATSADTNVYVRVYGSGGAAAMPEFAFSDVYLSTQKRLVPGGGLTFNIASGMEYETAEPYTCTHAVLMGLPAPEADLNGDCYVNMNDLVLFAESWLRNWFNNISGVAPWQ